jgi:hypothetical protein
MKKKFIKISEIKFEIITGVIIFSTSVFFYSLLFSLAFSKSLCCADDSYISVAAKNLAIGSGYGTSLSSSYYGIKQYEFGITTGPTLVVPAAIMIKIFGNLPWIPGLTSVILNLILTICIYFSSCKLFGFIKSNVFISILLLLCFGFFYPNWLLLWHSILGEVHASLYFLLGLILFQISEGKGKIFYLSILVFGLSILTKLIFLIPVFPFIFYAIVSCFFQKFNFVYKFKKSIIILMVLFSPYFLFELIKLIDLGLDSYFNYLLETFSGYLSIHGSGNENSKKFLFEDSVKLLKDNLGIDLLWIILSSLLYLIIILFSNMDVNTRKINLIAIFSYLISFIWWVFLSKGWIRYGYPWLFIFIYLSSFLIMYIRGIGWKLLIFMGILFFIKPFDFKNDYLSLKNYKFAFDGQTEFTKNLLATRDFLVKNQQYSPFISSWWATYADIEYILPSAYNFKRFDELDSADSTKQILVVRNLEWIKFTKVVPFEKFEKQYSDTIFFAYPYLVTTNSSISKK